MGYHIGTIIKGELGEVSKIAEEYLEFKDAIQQDNKIMALLELSDIIGAIEAYTMKYHQISIYDLIKMKDATKSAFTDGTRKSK